MKFNKEANNLKFLIMSIRTMLLNIVKMIDDWVQSQEECASGE